ncbi:NAD(P)H-binding protein [Catelliglobosispora koreensis]|uniref:NAD(P)H-binding protein n=1 Tax=Catelliglobosispora koreensis TaxID=129052 RepID=UPI00037EE68F|nr:NAD(P)H-binding protein [Catelliglobosispora koreensis]
MTILVLGATGTIGKRLTAQLREAGEVARPASRHGEVRFDWADQRTWEPAVDGATAMFLMAPHELPIDPAFVQVAVDRGIDRIALLSSRGIEEMNDERLLAAEETVKKSGASWTILRCDWFDQNFDEGFYRDAVMAGELAVPVGEIKQSFVDANDIAAVAAGVLTSGGHEGKTLEVTGPEGLSFAGACAIVSHAAGREVTFHGEPDAYRQAMGAFGSPPEQTEGEIKAFTSLREAGDSQPTGVVRSVTGRQPRRFADFAADAAARGAWITGRDAQAAALG